MANCSDLCRWGWRSGRACEQHRRNRQDQPQVRQPLDHPRRVGRGRAAGRELSRVDRDALPRFSRPTQSGQSGQSGVSGGSAAGRVSWAVLSSIDAAQWISHDTLPQLPHWACRLAGLVAKKNGASLPPISEGCGFLSPSPRVVHRRYDIDGATRAQDDNAPPARARPASPFSLRGLAPITAVIPVRVRIDSEHAVDASNDSTSRSANNPTNKATDRSEHAVTGIGTAVCPVVHPARHALRLCTDRRGEKESDSNHTEHSHLVSLLLCHPNRASRCWPLFGNKCQCRGVHHARLERLHPKRLHRRPMIRVDGARKVAWGHGTECRAR
jgi:hypothetical protein